MHENSNGDRASEDRDQGVAIVVLAVVVVIAGVFGIRALNQSQVRGSVEAETLGEEYVSAPCEVRSKYDGKKWTVTGVVAPRDPDRIPFSGDPDDYFAIVGGTYASDGRGCSGAVFRPFVEAREYNVDLRLQWDDSTAGAAEIGTTITVTCRLKLHGFGLNDGDGSISGSSCVPMTPDDS
ncbi:MAG: hypothetical protein GWP18_04860 [Proteobacteria bacterium]|nr:hypothetical protein [Pseudomonadota bacterium]